MSERIWPFRHVGLKVLSVGIAALLWLIVAGQETVERGLRIPLEFQQFPVGLELASDPPALVDVRVRGSSGTLSRVGPGDVVAMLDLRNAAPGQRLFQLTPEQVRAPFGVQVVQVNPASMAMTFEASATRRVPVVPSVDGSPAPGYVVGTVTIDPPEVEVTGPQTAVARVSEAMTEPVSVAGASEGVRQSVTVGFADPTLRLRTPRQATVVVPIVPAPLERTIRDRPIHLRNLGASLSAQAEPAVAGVVVRGTRQGLSRVEPENVSAFVDLAGLGPGESSLAVHADTPRDAGVVRTDPPSVEIRITSGTR